MVNTRKHQKTIEREQIVIDLLKKGETVSGASIEKKLGISLAVRSKLMVNLSKEHKEIQNIAPPMMEAQYKWIEDKPEPPIIDSITIPVMTPTLVATQETGKILPGETWQTEESNGTKGMIFALNSLNGACQGIKLYPDTEENRAIVGANPFTIDILGGAYIGDPTHVTFKPLKYCIRRRLFTHTDKLQEAREALAKIFGIPEKEIIKTVKAKPEVKVVYRDRVVEKKDEPEIPDTYVDAKSAYLVTIERECAIWKEVATKLLNRNS